MLTSVAVALAFAAMPALIVAAVPQTHTGIANGLNSISRSVGSAIAGAAVATILAARHVAGTPAGVPAIPAESGFTLAFAISGVCCAVACVVVLVGLPRPTAAGPPPVYARAAAGAGRTPR